MSFKTLIAIVAVVVMCYDTTNGAQKQVKRAQILNIRPNRIFYTHFYFYYYYLGVIIISLGYLSVYFLSSKLVCILVYECTMYILYTTGALFKNVKCTILLK